MLKYFLNFFCLMLISSLLLSCNDSNITELQKVNLNLEEGIDSNAVFQLKKNVLIQAEKANFSFKGAKDSLKGKKIKIKNKYGEIVDGTIEAYQCGTLDVGIWDFERWETAPGYVVGIRPNTSWMGDNNKLELLKNYYGFSHIMLFQQYINNSVYTKDKIIADIGGATPQYVINCFQNETGHFYAFYTDEPYHVIDDHENVRDSLIKMRTWLDNNQNLTYDYFAAGETKVSIMGTMYGYAHAFDDIVDFLNCTKYDNCWEGICEWTDQRFLWTDFQNAFGSKLDNNWISATRDVTEFDELLGHNLNQGKSKIWLYAGGSEDGIQFDSFCLRAWMHGYMLRVERYCYYTYECSEPDPCDCDPTNIVDGWYLVDTYCTSMLRERSY